MALLRLIADHAGERRPALLGAATLTMLDGLLAATPAIGLATLLAVAGTSDTPIPAHWLVGGAALLLAALVARTLCANGARGIGFRAAYHATRGLRTAIMDRLVAVPLGTFARWSSGRLALIATEHVRWVETAASFVLGELLAAGATVVVLVTAAILLSPVVGLGILAGLLLQILGTALADWSLRRFLRRITPQITEASRRIEEHLQGLPTIKAHGALARRESGVIRAAESIRDTLIGVVVPTTFPTKVGGALNALSVLVGFALAYRLSQGEAAPVGGAIGAALLGFAISRIVGRSFGWIAQLRLGQTSAREIKAFLDESPLTARPPLNIPDRFDVTFDNVSFRYEARAGQGEAPQPAALTRLSFTAPAGKVTAIVGPSGAGKSTILSLVARHHDVTEGTVRIGGVDLRQIAPGELARLVTFVEQEPFLFERSLADNVRLGDPEADRAALDAAAADARLGEVLDSLPRGWETPVGEAGGTLSGGERQRVAIARAALKAAPVVLLDEATASLDAVTDVLVRDALSGRFKGRTVLMVTHRLASLAQADKIVVVEGGRAVEEGTHRDLLAHHGLYARLWAAEQRAVGWRLGQGSRASADMVVIASRPPARGGEPMGA